MYIKSWEEMSSLEQLQANYSDAYKEAYGFRPIGYGDIPEEELQKLYEPLN